MVCKSLSKIVKSDYVLLFVEELFCMLFIIVKYEDMF